MRVEEQIIVEAIMQTRSQVDFLWQFFMTVQVAIFAMLFIYDKAVESLNWFAKLFALGGIGMFDWINSQALKSSYILLDALHQQYRVDFGQPGRFQPALYDHFVLASFEGRLTTISITHGMAFAVVIMAFFWRRFIPRPDARPSSADA